MKAKYSDKPNLQSEWMRIRIYSNWKFGLDLFESELILIKNFIRIEISDQVVLIFKRFSTIEIENFFRIGRIGTHWHGHRFGNDLA